MTSLPPNPRYEKKAVTDERTLPEVLALVRRHPAVFREAYPPRTVNNLYLDSPDLRDYRDHTSGVAHRSKTRLRWYGPWSGPIAKPTLECKLRRGLLSGKETHRLPPIVMNGIVAWPELQAGLDRAGLPERLRAALRHLEPSLLNRYQRHYFLSADRRFRLTVDSGLQFAAAQEARNTSVAFGPPARVVVIELKFDPADADRARSVTNALPFRLARCSKYVLGIDQLRRFE